MAGEDSNTVLAFLLGSKPSLDDSSPVSRAESVEAVEAVDDPPELEPVSDSDVDTEAATSATGGVASTSDWDAITSCESEDEAASEKQVEAAQEEERQDDPVLRCKEAPASKSCVKDSNVAEAEHEDDSIAPIIEDSDDGVQQEARSLPKKETQKAQRSITVEKQAKTTNLVTKARRGSIGNRAGTAASSNSSTKTTLKRDGNEPTLEEFLFVGCVAMVLVAYLVACVYSFFHPLVVPLPDYDKLYSAYDISNVSVHIVNPAENSLITPQGISFEWKLINFPTEALHLSGAEVFRYQVSLDDEVITSEVGFLSIQEEDSGADALNRTVRIPIPLRKITRDEVGESTELFKLHLEVTIPIPGLIEELKTYEQIVYVRKPAAPSPEDEVHLTFTSPLNGATIEQNQSIVLEYTAVNVRTMEVLLDDSIYFKKTHVNDGNMMLRGLGIGPHKFEIRAVDEQNEVAASSIVHVKIIERF